MTDLPRPMLENEREVLLAILDARSFPGRDALRAQAETAVVSGYCQCGCASIDLEVDPGAPRPVVRMSSPIPNEAVVHGPDGESVGGIIVFLNDHKRLSLLEVFSYFEPISQMPTLAELTF